MKRLIVFDLDGTLAISKSSLDDEMAQMLTQLIRAVKVAVISGGGWPQFQKQLLANLPEHGDMKNLSLLPTSGTRFYRYVDEWEQLYAENFTPSERDKILDSLKKAIAGSGLKFDRLWGEQIEDRGSQITFSALGQEAPIEEKEKWDPNFERRKKVQSILAQLIPEVTVGIGGTTSIDITKPGVDKAYGIHKLRETLGIPISEMIFIGDAIFPGGNDYPAKLAGVTSIRVRDPEETKRVIEAILACLAPASQSTNRE